MYIYIKAYLSIFICVLLVVLFSFVTRNTAIYHLGALIRMHTNTNTHSACIDVHMKARYHIPHCYTAIYYNRAQQHSQIHIEQMSKQMRTAAAPPTTTKTWYTFNTCKLWFQCSKYTQPFVSDIQQQQQQKQRFFFFPFSIQSCKMTFTVQHSTTQLYAFFWILLCFALICSLILLTFSHAYTHTQRHRHTYT